MENTERNCCICGSNTSLFQLHEKWICERCLSIGNEKRNSLWTEAIEKLLEEYTEACLGCLAADESENLKMARVLGRKMQAILKLSGLSKNHTLLLPIRKVDLILNTIKEADELIDEIASQNEENKVNAEMVKLFTKKQKNANERLTKKLPKLINDSYYTVLTNFINEELNFYDLLFVQEKALRKYEARFNELVKAYDHSVEVNGKTALPTTKILHKIRKKAKSLSYLYGFLNDMHGGQYKEKEIYYNNIQHQIAKVHDMKDWLDQLKTIEKKIHAPKKEKTAVKNALKERINSLIEHVELHTVTVNEG